jgi:nucleoside phosphorylase
MTCKGIRLRTDCQHSFNATILDIVMASNNRPSRRQDFQIAIICALSLEFDAVSLLFDEFWDEDGEQYGRAAGDTNTYTTGRIGKYDVVMVLLPNMGKAAAAGAASSFRSSYSSLKLAFLVGICGGVPNIGGDEALLGDVVISKSVIQHDFGRQYPDRFVPKDTLEDSPGRPNKDIRSLIASLETELGRERVQHKAAGYLKDLQSTAVRKRRRRNYGYPGPANDQLFSAKYRHMHRDPQTCRVCGGETEGVCEIAAKENCVELGCEVNQLVPRKRLVVDPSSEAQEAYFPEIFIGRIASGDTVLKSGEHRDRVAAQNDVIAFEMEGAGAWDEVPCVIIKGICDYADSHKNKAWQPFAAATAAAVMKAVLERYTLADAPASGGHNTGTSESFQPPPIFIMLVHTEASIASELHRSGGSREISNNTFGNGTQINQGDTYGGAPFSWNGVFQ